MHWYYNDRTGSVIQWNDLAIYVPLHSGLGWHGPFNSKQEALNYYNTNKANNPGWKAPTGIIGNVLNESGIGGAAVQAVSSSVANVKGGFNLQGWFIRGGEILLGLVLIGVGVAALTHIENVVSKAVNLIPAGRIAKAVK